jgi:hypothetical protein
MASHKAGGVTEINLFDRHVSNWLSVEEFPSISDLQVYMRVDAIWVSQESLVAFAKDVIDRYGS